MTQSETFAIFTPPQQVSYEDLLRVWLEADATPSIDQAWLFDHLLPIGGDPTGPVLEAWTTLTALAAQTSRLRLGILVTSNRIRPPALLAKIAATVDIVSAGRLDFGIGAGSRPDVPMARKEYDAHGLPYQDFGDSVAALDEALTVITRLWTEDEPFTYNGRHLMLDGAFCNPKPRQRPHPPILIGGRSSRTLRVAAAHANTWNYAGSDLPDARMRNAVLDRHCHELGRDPASIARSLIISVDYDKPATSIDAIQAARASGFDHFVLAVPAPYPNGVAAWLAASIIQAA